MRLSESRAAGRQRFIWIAAFVVALWLSLVYAGAAFAGGDHPSAGWQDHTEGTSTSWGDTSDEGHPPPETPGTDGPCNDEGNTPPGETPPTDTPPAETPPAETPPTDTPSDYGTPPDHGTPPTETPPVETPPTDTPPTDTPPDHGTPPTETPPVQTPPVQTPPVQTPPVETPPVQTPPVQTPPVETPPVETPDSPTSPESPETPNTPVDEEGRGGDEVLPQEQGQGGGGIESPTSEVTEAAPAAGSLPFTGGRTPLLVLFGVALLGLGVGLRRVATEQG
jgi:hypothetical protein